MCLYSWPKPNSWQWVDNNKRQWYWILCKSWFWTCDYHPIGRVVVWMPQLQRNSLEKTWWKSFCLLWKKISWNWIKDYTAKFCLNRSYPHWCQRIILWDSKMARYTNEMIKKDTSLSSRIGQWCRDSLWKQFGIRAWNFEVYQINYRFYSWDIVFCEYNDLLFNNIESESNRGYKSWIRRSR